VIFSNFTALDLSAMPSLTRKEARAHRVPLIDANQDSLLGFGRMVADFAHEPVTIVTWPQPDWRHRCGHRQRGWNRRGLLRDGAARRNTACGEPGSWTQLHHQPVFPLARTAIFDDRQGRVHACVAVNFVSEFGCYLKVPLPHHTA